MHPAYSIVVFTTATGAGYGLLALLGLLVAFGAIPGVFWLGLTGLGLALGLISAGLISSAAHLGRPERAWRALSQWRSSWLSREAVAALATFVLAGLFAIGWVVLGRTDGWIAVAGALAAVGAAVTVSTTAMIYASLKPIAQWHSPFTLPGYLIYAAMTGAVLLNALLQGFGLAPPWVPGLAISATLLGGAWKVATWRHNDALLAVSTAGTATGLAGSVRSIEWPHTEENFVLKEMGYRIARKHAAKLRTIVRWAAFVLPGLLLAAAMATWDSLMPPPLSLLAALLQAVGILIERWLFFAEARHTVTLYYGR